MKTKYLFLAALTSIALVSCTSDEFLGENTSPTVVEESTEGAILFGSGFRAITRANKTGRDAAELLGNEFYVKGVKGDGTGTGQTNVFNSYTVNWAQNTAGTTESNTADWEYVGKTNHFGLTGAQAIKYWDYNTTAYDFCAFSIGAGNTLITTGTPTAGQILAPATGISYNATEIGSTGKYQISDAYTLRGAKADLIKCYITDMKTVAKGDYQKEVELKFRSLATKVRMALYETVPGYSVKDVEFFQDDATTDRSTDIHTNTSATLFGDDVFYSSGTYTISFPKIGSGNSGDSDYNKAHVTISGSTAEDTQAFGTLNYTTEEDHEAPGSFYLGRASNTPSFAGTGTWYQNMLPNENGVVLEMRVNYTLVATDGSGEEIKVYGAKAFIPAKFTKWLPNYAYTYLFKISDNTNGWTNPSGDDDKAGLFPITFDAVVLDPEETGKQTTITTVATPSITTYQKGHVYSASNEYKSGDIYVQVHNDGTLANDLNGSTPLQKSYLYKLTGKANPTEALVMDALNIRESESAGPPAVITGRNGVILTAADFDAEITAIPGEDGNDITVTAGEAVKFAATAGTYAYVYQVSAGASTDPVITTIVLATAPGDWNATDNVYYTDATCNTQANESFVANKTYYKKYTDLNNVYAVKVIKVQ